MMLCRETQYRQNPSITVAEHVELHVHMVELKLPISPEKMAELRSSTMDDVTLQSGIIHTLTEWPNYVKDVPERLKAFFIVRSLLSVSNFLLTYTDQIVIPTLLRSDMRKKIHKGHQWITKCLEQARVSTRDNARHQAQIESLRTFSSPQT